MEKVTKKRKNNYTLPSIFLTLSVLTLIFAIYIEKNTEKPLVPDQTKERTAAVVEQQYVSDVQDTTEHESVETDIFSTKVDDLSGSVQMPFDVFSNSIYLYDMNSGEAIYTKNPQIQSSPASLTKVMTALLAIEMTENLDSKMLTFTEEMAEELLGYGYSIYDIATFNFEVGEQISMRNALYILMLRSANDAANLIAYSLGNGSKEAFVDMMNDKAREIGAYDTNFTNPHGLDDDELYTTAYDMFLITEYAMKHPEFLEICSTVIYPLPASNMREALGIETVIQINNPNRYMYYNPNVVGIKTGLTDAAGKCLISTYSNEGKNFLLVLMGSPSGGEYPPGLYFEETSRLYEWAYANS